MPAASRWGATATFFTTIRLHCFIGCVTAAKKTVVLPAYNLSAFSLTPDGSLVLAFAYARTGGSILSVQIAPDGTPQNPQLFHQLENTGDENYYGVRGSVHDAKGWYYVTTTLGIQICDQAGRVNAVMNIPPKQNAVRLAWGGKNRDWLYLVTDNRQLWRRRMRVQGVNPCDAPVKPPAPRL